MENENLKKELIHPLDQSADYNSPTLRFIVMIFIAALFFGVITGFIISQVKKSTPFLGQSKQTIGVKNSKTSKDSATGILKEGGIDGEGNFHIERPGGQSQNVYLTSSVVDLSAYVGKKVRVWGETFKGQKAGWLMDVGMVEIL